MVGAWQAGGDTTRSLFFYEVLLCLIFLECFPNNVIKYRVALVDDYNASHTFISYQRYGSLEIWDACSTTWPHRGYNYPTDSLRLYLNGELVGEYKTRSQAQAKALELILGCPVDITSLAATYGLSKGPGRINKY